MIKELINFTESLDTEVLDSSKAITNGLHFFVDKNSKGELFVSKVIDSNNEVNLDIIQRILDYEKYSSYLTMNKQQKFDKNQKIHSSSPFSFAFNFSLGSKKKQIEADLKIKIVKKEIKNSLRVESNNFKIEEVKSSIASYFNNAKRLCLADSSDYDLLIEKFEKFCTDNLFDLIMYKNQSPGQSDLKNYSERYQSIKEKEYVKVYLICIPIEEWKVSYQHYFENEYPPNKFIVNDFFCTTYNQKKPFFIHQTASFDKSLKLKGSEATVIKKFESLAKSKPKILPNPLPIFIYKEELNNKVISIFREDGKIGYKEIIERIFQNHGEVLNNYYLLNWFYGKELQVVDIDFVSKFEYKMKDLAVHNLFQIKEKGSKDDKYYPRIKNIFEFEQLIFKPLLQNKYLRLDYFGDLSKDDYEKHDLAFISYSKYRKSVYDFVYKSQRNTIDGNVFYEMVFNAILDNLKNGNSYGIKEKLNIWYSLYEYFNPKQNINMINKLKEYQDFVESILHDEELTDITDEKFAFAAGQVIEYILSKSKSADSSYNLLEPYLQQSKCVEFKKAIANDFGRYKHENFSKNFEKVAAVVLSYETDTNLKHLLPQLLSGVFAKNQLFSSNNIK